MQQNIFEELEKELKNPNLTREQKVRLIEDAGNKYRNSIDDDLKRYIRDQRIGAGLQIGAAMIPVGGVGGSVARQVVPKVAQKTLGRQFTTDIAASAIGSAIDGAVYGYGRGLMEGKNPTQTALEDSAFGFGAGAAVGGAIGKLVSKARAAETKGINQMRKYWGIPWRKASGNPELAIKTLMDHQRGFVPNVFNKQGIGNFDLPWGNSNFGLQHIIKRRNSQGINTENFVKNIPNIIKEGKSFNKKGHIDRVYLSNNIDEIAVRQNYKPENGSNIKRNWVTSTYRNYDKIKNPQADPVLLTSDTITQTNRIPLPDLGIKYNINDYLLKNNPAEWLSHHIIVLENFAQIL